MNSLKANMSPSFKNIVPKPKQSPIELKEKLRKNYKIKVQKCRGALIDRLRGSLDEKELCGKLTEIYANECNDQIIDNEELELLEEIRKELIQEELDWWIKQYETSHLDDIDWSALEEENSVICPICLKNNFTFENNNNLCCTSCNISFKTDMSLLDVKKSIEDSLEKHNLACSREAQFTIIPDTEEIHMYIFCEFCKEMKCVI
ncbi:RPA-interacting protein [Manduca sexta]|uniref:RPA-interacting protein n=1 Tax=Manduca sexta TaxID=7130 RepID=UPI001182CF1F|nr:RPA-interacting protein [Manduca sexta]